MTGRAGRSGVVVFTKNPLSSLEDIHGVHAGSFNGSIVSNTMLGLVIDLNLRMVRTDVTFTTVLGLTGNGSTERVLAVTGVTYTCKTVRIQTTHTGVGIGHRIEHNSAELILQSLTGLVFQDGQVRSVTLPAAVSRICLVFH